MNNLKYNGTILFVGCASRPEKLRAHSEHPVAVASTMDDAVSQIRHEDISCVVSEYLLEDGTGLDLLESIRDDFSGLPFLLWTADGNEEIASRAITAGVTDYIIHDGELDGRAVDRILNRIKALDQTRSEATASRKQRLFDLLLDTCPTGIVVLNGDREIVRTNARAEDILGVPGDEITDRVFSDPNWDIIDWDGEPIQDGELPARRVQATGEAIYGEKLGVKRPDGERTWLLVNSVPVTDPGTGSTDTDIVIAFEEVTEQRQQEKRLARNERKFSAVFEEAFDAMLIADDNTEYVDVNPAACELFGLSREELLGRSIAEFAADDYDFEAAWQEFRESDRDRGYFPLVRADGEERIVEFAATPDILPGRHLSVLRDVTEHRRTVNELNEIFDRVTDAVHGLDTEWRFTHLNDQAEELLGRTEEELRGEYVWDEFPDALERSYRERYERAMETQETVVFEEYSDAARAWLEVRVYPSETGLSIYFRDITERKVRERELEEYRRQSEALIDNFPNGAVGLVDQDLRYVMFGGQLGDLNATSANYEGKPVREVMPQNHRDVVVPRYEAALGGEASAFEKRIDETVYQFHFVPVRDDTGEVFAAMGMAQDITDRKEQEQELKASEEKFRSLIETAPDPIFVADTETGEIVESNTVACTIRKQSRDEIIGLHQSALHPEEDADRYETLFERQIGRGGTISEFPDGSPIYLTTADGERIPVAISSKTVHFDDRTLIHGIFRDISEQKRYEKSLEKLNRAAQDFLAAETDHEIAQTTVDIAEDVLDVSGVAVYFYDEDDGILKPAAYPTATEELLGEIPTFSPGDSIAWRVYTTQEQAVFDNVRSDDDVYNPGTSIRSELVLPLGKHGVFLAGDPKLGVFDDLTVDLAEVLTTTAETALNRIDWARQLQEQEREAKLHARHLERVNQINEKFRSVIQAIVHAESRPGLEEAICNDLVEIDRFEFAWIGTPDFVASELSPSSWAGKSRGYLESISLDLDSDGGVPSLTAAQKRETTVVSNIAGSLQQESWRQDALLENYRSVISVPILHEEVLYGVLTIYGSQPSTFDSLSTAVLTDLGEVIGYALNAIERRSAFHENSDVELAFELSELEDQFIALASRLATDIEIRNITSRPDGSYVVYLLARDVDPDRFTDEVRSVTAISEVRPVGDAERGQFELIVSESCIITDAAEFAPIFRSITISEQEGRISITIPQDRDVRSFIAQFRDQYPDITLVGRQDTERDGSSFGPSSLLDQLTTRQQEVLRAAYYGGFFDQPRKSTGSEIANSLGISQPAFSKQLRNGERKLLKPLYDPD